MYVNQIFKYYLLNLNIPLQNSFKGKQNFLFNAKKLQNDGSFQTDSRHIETADMLNSLI